MMGAVEISPSQAVQLMSLAQLLHEGDLAIRGDEDEDVEAAYALIADVAQEIALQVPQHIEESKCGDQADALKIAREAIRGLLDITSEYNLDSEQAGRAYAALHEIGTALAALGQSK